jgi:hypothetical protein
MSSSFYLEQKTLARAVVAAKRLKYLRKARLDATGFLHPSVRQAMKNSCKINARSKAPQDLVRSVAPMKSNNSEAECEAQLDKGFPQKSGPTKQETH